MHPIVYDSFAIILIFILSQCGTKTPLRSPPGVVMVSLLVAILSLVGILTIGILTGCFAPACFRCCCGCCCRGSAKAEEAAAQAADEEAQTLILAKNAGKK